ncbi:Malonyl-coenzyme A:anthocyanin 3-O-glucoside-6''-O-malonyltransferase [Vitis vinifera]|uniref:Malonyl-coenzyme A:anthocyanin 3-O-glucoside-6''-O-malonyltransferase n=1 Tax=Vitis vinifera TaxID=29760 RepID=A0A438IEN4_VITVI|nr:Malonyl-coenzyme A:anthocyanin 3-O-glucoside-6''-O-malonyltransferase [Vitis vinifera]
MRVKSFHSICECLARLVIPNKIPKCPLTRLPNSSSDYLTLKTKILLRDRVTYAYTWACIVKAQVWSGEEGSENELEHFGFVVDCRARLNPPLPENYFGEAIREKLGSKEGVLKGLEKLSSNFEPPNLERLVGVAGSPSISPPPSTVDEKSLPLTFFDMLWLHFPSYSRPRLL